MGGEATKGVLRAPGPHPVPCGVVDPGLLMGGGPISRPSSPLPLPCRPPTPPRGSLELGGVPAQLHVGAPGAALQPRLRHLQRALLGHDGSFQQHDGVLRLEDLLQRLRGTFAVSEGT